MAGKWKYQLVLQFPGTSLADFDRLIEIENAVGDGLGKGAFLDGHDFGSGAGNIFIYVNDPGPIFDKAMQLLDDRARGELRAGYRKLDGEEYTVLWPHTLKAFALI